MLKGVTGTSIPLTSESQSIPSKKFCVTSLTNKKVEVIMLLSESYLLWTFFPSFCHAPAPKMLKKNINQSVNYCFYLIRTIWLSGNLPTTVPVPSQFNKCLYSIRKAKTITAIIFCSKGKKKPISKNGLPFHSLNFQYLIIKIIF